MLTFSTAYGPPNDGHTIRLTAHSRARCEVYLDCLGATEEETTRPGALDHGMVSSSRSTEGTAGRAETTMPGDRRSAPITARRGLLQLSQEGLRRPCQVTDAWHLSRQGGACFDCWGATEDEMTMPGALDHGMEGSSSRSIRETI